MFLTYSRKGPHHQWNQDYVAFKNKRMVLCDGCSTQPNTDIGSRLLCHSILSYTRWNTSITLSKGICIQLGIPVNALSCTILDMYVNEYDMTCLMSGDGVVFGGMFNGPTYYFCRDYKAIVPYYLYSNEGLTKNIPENEIFVSEHTDQSVRHVNFPKQSDSFTGMDYVQMRDLDYYGIASDGLLQLLKAEERTPLCISAAIEEITRFKVPAGDFLTRRLNRMFKTHTNLDDFTIGLWVNDNEHP
jgi:hypothetical protein